jgi:HAE1 family hydrophobic/amphiphilic exporter-1
MNLSAPFIKRPVMTTFLILALVIAGLLAYTKLPVSDLPTIERPHIQVTAGYTGASPETILNLVTIPLEKELLQVKGLQEISSRSSQGHSSISLSFDLEKNMDQAIRDVQSALNRAEGILPREVNPRPAYHLQEDSQEPIMYILLTSDQSNAKDLQNYADAYILPRLNRIPGVANVMLFGTENSIYLRLNPELMAARQIGFDQVADTIKQYTSQVPLGTIQTTNKILPLEMTGMIKHAKELENLHIGKTAVRLKDIGEISDKSDDVQEFHFINGEITTPALILGVQKINDGNTVAVSKGVQEALDILRKELPPSIHLNLWFNKAVWINESITDVEWSLFIAFALVIIVIYFSLGRVIEALIISVALPLSLIGTFSVMYLLGYSLDLLSLLALTLSVGFVVDDAIVVLENIVRYQEEGFSPREASLKGSQQICFTIFSMTLSLVAVFIPLLFMPGMDGRLFREFSMTLAVSILVSGFISLVVTPMLCSRFLSSHQVQTKIQKAVIDVNAKLSGYYGKSLKWCLHYPKSILLIALACMLATIPLFTKLSVNLVPPEDRGFLFAFVNLPSGLSNTEVQNYQNKLEKLVNQNAHIENFLGLSMGGNLIFVIRLVPLEERLPQPAVIAELQKALDAIPGTQTFIQGYHLINLDLDLGSGGQFKYVVRGMEFKDVEKAAETITKALKENPAITYAKSSLSNDSPKLVVNVNEDLVHKLGIPKSRIQNLLQEAYGQGSAGSIQKGAYQEKIYMELQEKYKNNAAALARLYLTSDDGTLIPLKSLATWEEKLDSPRLMRREQLPSTSIRFSLAESISPNEGLKLVEKIAEDVMPSNVSGFLDGAAKSIASTIQNTLFLLLAAALVMYIVLGILYESFIHPLTILSSLPFAGLGGILTLFLFNEPVSIFSAVGFLLLIGIVKKNGIMMIDYALEAQKQGVDKEQAIFDGCLVRFRPIMMTTITAIMGAVPIAVGFGDGAEMRQGLGLVIVGGLLFSQVLTLYVTPILYLTFEKLRKNKQVIY